jgi:hypothetical protein
LGRIFGGRVGESSVVIGRNHGEEILGKNVLNQKSKVN